MARLGMARSGEARLGGAWRGEARRGRARVPMGCFGGKLSHMRARLNRWLTAAWRKLNPINPLPRLKDENRALTQALAQSQARESGQRDEAHRFLAEMVEAQAMCGSGPWAPGDVNAYAAASKPLQEALQLREAGPVGDISPAGAYGLYELLLQNVNWQREINYSWLEFTRWGIQQIILICRLYYIKNPIVRRLVDVCAQYVFARGVDVSTDDDDANDVIKAFFERNQRVLGKVALLELEKSKDRDGNIFLCFFTDQSTGDCDVRTIDATEIQDIWTDPEDADIPQLYHRIWTQRSHDPASAAQSSVTRHAWYPALDYNPPAKPEAINGYPVFWDSPVYHRKCAAVGKWLFGCPRIYPMLDWAKETRRYLEACASLAQSLSQFALSITTKGGQQAIEGIKQQMETQVGPGAPIYDTNPPAVAGASWISGPGTEMSAFKTQGAGLDPEKSRQYKLMCCMVKGVPETFLGDVSTGNLATATTLDRPTETVMLSLQEEWTEDLTIIAKFVLSKSLRAPGSNLRASLIARKIDPGVIEVRECARKRLPDGSWRYVEAKKPANAIDIRVDFPSIREGDAVAETGAIVAAMTLNNKGGQVVGIDEKEGVKLLYRSRGVEQGDELAEAQYPDKSYDPDRTKEELPPPIAKLPDQPGIQPQPGNVPATVATQTGVQPPKPKATEALRRSAKRVLHAMKMLEAQGDDD